MQRDLISSVIAVSGLIGAGAGLTETGYIFVPQSQQSAQPTQPQTPSRQPTPAQPTQPNQPAQTQPRQTDPRGPERLPTDRRDDRREQKPGELRPQQQRPFTFQSPQAEARFNESSKRLVQMEQRMQRSNQELLRRLGEARSLSGERQTTAVMDLLQQFLNDQADMQRYLTQSRSTLTGDPMDDDASELTPRDQRGSEPADRPRTPDLAPRTPDSAPRTPPVAPGTNTPPSPGNPR